MDWLCFSIVVLMLSSITWSFECPQGLNCNTCQPYPEGQLEVQCTISNNVAFNVRIQPRKSVAITCTGNPNWTDFHLGTKNPMENIAEIYFENCNLPPIGFVAVTKQLVADEVSYLTFRSMNNETLLTRKIFREFNNLKKLALRFKNLPNLTEDVLEDTSLDKLDMSTNFLELLPKGIFKNMRKLRYINLSENNFTREAIPGDLFKNNVELVLVAISNNKRNITSLPNGFFANLKKLEIVNLKNSGLIYLPEDLFWGTRNLRRLSFESNYLNTLPSKVFKDTTEIIHLDLNANHISHLPDDVFEKLGKLEYLDLSRNHLTSINEKLFAGLTGLKEISMTENGLKTIDIGAFNFTRNLQIARFSNNELTLQPTLRSSQSPRLSPFHACGELEYLYLSYNNVSNIFDDWKSLKLIGLNLSHNQLQVLRDIDFQFLTQNLNVSLDYNNVSYIDLTTIEDWAMKGQPRGVAISIENNPIQCDCRLYDFLRYLDGRMHPNVNKTLELLIGISKCHGPSEFRDIAITDLRSKTLTCNVNEGDLKVECPDTCNCYMRPENEAFIIDCSYKGLIEAPRKLDFPPNLRIGHIELNLTGNYLRQMPNLNQNGYNNVTILMLDHNNISSVTVNGLSNKLEVLKLNNNKIRRMSSDAINVLKSARTLRNLTLEANPWLCDCDARDFLKFIQEKSASNSELLKIKCNGSDSLIIKMRPEKLCPTNATWIIAACLTIAFTGIIIISILTALYYRYQQKIKYLGLRSSMLPLVRK